MKEGHDEAEARYEAGLRVRREVLGADHVARAQANTTPLDADFQRFITEVAWGSVWTRPDLDRRTRSLITIAILAALGRTEELALHLRASRRTGADPREIAEALLHVAVYAGVPAGNTAFRLAREALGQDVVGLGRPTEEELMASATTSIGAIVRGDREVFPPFLYDAYRSTIRRAPNLPLVDVPLTLSELTGPGPAVSAVTPEDADLTRNAGTSGEAIGQRIIVTGRVLDERGRPVPNTLVEVWQANAAGRYIHRNDQWPGPLDPNFLGIGRCLTDEQGEYRFLTIRPGAYPWRNHPNAWRPAHIHFSLFGPSLVSRLVTQMYFPDDPLHVLDPILSAVPEAARPRLIARYDHAVTQQEWALGWRWDIVLRGPEATPFEPPREPGR